MPEEKYPNLESDIIKVLPLFKEKPVKNSTVRERLIELDPKTYTNISPDWVKKMLKRMIEGRKIFGGKDEETGIYLWKRKRGDKE